MSYNNQKNLALLGWIQIPLPRAEDELKLFIESTSILLLDKLTEIERSEPC